MSSISGNQKIAVFVGLVLAASIGLAQMASSIVTAR